MRLETSVEIPFSRQQVFDIYRDRLPQLVPYLPNVRGIEVLSRADEGHLSRMVNKWQGGGEIPAAVRSVVSSRYFEWEDHALWDAKAYTVEWKTIVPAFREALHAAGINRYEELGSSRTRLVITGNLVIDPSKVPGVPRLVAKPIASAVEGFLLATIKPNLIAVSKGVEKYLAEGRN